MSRMMSCAVGCKCGGMVKELIDGVFYSVTIRQTIIFCGICDKCREPVAVEKDIVALLMLCETKGVQ